MKFGSLFSGIGGFDLGFERAGMECAWQCEIDKNCQSLLQQRFGVKLYDDVRTITRDNAEPVDLICGGFPCQDVSIAGKRAGFAGERSGLWSEFARIIDELKPGWVVIENVPGLLSSNNGRDFQTVLDQMVKSGYGVCWRILDAQYFGVAQRRRRVFIVGSLGNGRAAEVLFESEGVRWNPPPRGKTGEGTAGETCSSIEGRCYKGINSDNLDHIVAYENHPADSRITETGDISQQLTSRMGTGGGNVPLVAHSELSGYRMAAFGEYADDGTSSAMKQRYWKDATDLIATSSLVSNGDAHSGFRDEKGLVNNVVGVRRLTPTECERLQGFPDGWTTGQSDSTRYKQLGNAVAVPVAEWIGRRIVEDA